jgi:ferredoxin
MTFVVTEACIRCRYGECVDVCPQQALREGPAFMVIDPEACANCGLCEMVCPVQAIRAEHALAPEERHYVKLNADLARRWPAAVNRGPLQDADVWALESGKLALFPPE